MSRSDTLVARSWHEALHGVQRPMSRAARTASRRYADAVRLRFRLLIAMTVIAAMLAVALFTWMCVARRVSQSGAEDLIAQTRRSSRESDDMDSMIAQARSYNERLASVPQIIGEAVIGDGVVNGDFAFAEDTDYHGVLDLGDSIMGALRIPKIGLLLPIRHGAGEYALSNGIGHLHGTSLPVGGNSTHTVLTGHRGLADKELFTRLDELEVGDPLYVELGDERTLAYQVERILETEPDRTDELRIVKGRDLITLVTCTPIMLNTRRLLVTAIRARMPDVVPVPESAPGDVHPKETSLIVGASCLAFGWSVVVFWGSRRRRRHGVPAKHMTEGNP